MAMRFPRAMLRAKGVAVHTALLRRGLASAMRSATTTHCFVTESGVTFAREAAITKAIAHVNHDSDYPVSMVHGDHLGSFSQSGRQKYQESTREDPADLGKYFILACLIGATTALKGAEDVPPGECAPCHMINRYILHPIALLLDPEDSHKLAIWAASRGFMPVALPVRREFDVLSTNVWGIDFQNPIGLAAGFDKNAEAVDGLLDAGFGFVEIGTVVPEPQQGNPRPRVFRLPQDGAVINRYGFNSDGLEVVKQRLVDRLANPDKNLTGRIGLNIGANKTSSNPRADYPVGLKALSEYSDYMVVNISSPNTPGLRSLQNKAELQQLLSVVMGSRTPGKPLLVKIHADMSPTALQETVSVLVKYKVDGIIVCNTTVSRPDHLKDNNKLHSGGLSGRPLRSLSTQTIRRVYEMTNGKVPIIGVGGVENGGDAYDKIRAGASLVQLYTALGYKGPRVVSQIKEELVFLLERDGYKNVAEAVGSMSKIGNRK